MKGNSKPAIIILHGWGLSAARFNPLNTALTKKGYRVFVPDFPGFGKSQMPDRPYMLADYADFLENYIVKHHISQFVLLGHSFGGRVALKYTSTKHNQPAGLILTGTPGYTPVPKKKLAVFIVLAKIGKFVFSIWPLTIIRQKIRLWYYYLVGAREFYRAEGVMRDTFKHIVREDLVLAMRSVAAPCLLVWGQDDRITPVWIAKKMQTVVPHSTLVIIPGYDHGVPFKHPDIFVRYISEFLNRL